MTNKNIYEIGMLLNPDLSQQEAEEVVTKVKEIITKTGASVLSEGEIVNIELAYQITTKIASKNERFDEAHFVWIKFEAESGSISEIKRGIDKIKKEVFRYLITKTISDDELTDRFRLVEDEEVEELTDKDIETEEVEDGDTTEEVVEEVEIDEEVEEVEELKKD